MAPSTWLFTSPVTRPCHRDSLQCQLHDLHSSDGPRCVNWAQTRCLRDSWGVCPLAVVLDGKTLATGISLFRGGLSCERLLPKGNALNRMIVLIRRWNP